MLLKYLLIGIPQIDAIKELVDRIAELWTIYFPKVGFFKGKRAESLSATSGKNIELLRPLIEERTVSA